MKNLVKDGEKKKLKAGKYVPAACKIDKDEKGFLKSFSTSELEEAKSFFFEHGFVIVNGVLGKEECELTIDEIWDTVEERTAKAVDRNDPKTWDKWTGIRGGNCRRTLHLQKAVRQESCISLNLHSYFVIFLKKPSKANPKVYR